MPSSAGISRSISTTSGRSRAASVNGLGAVAGLADHLEIRLRRQHGREPVAHHRMIVGEEDANHERRRGTSAVIRVPAPGELST